jgi:polyferredoxin
MLVSIINGLISAVATAINFVVGLLPASPFAWTPSAEMADWLKAINYFIPLGTMLGIMVTYCAAALLWYAVRGIMRAIRYIQ